MSRLSVYWPDECEAVTTAVLDEPRLLQFPRSRQRTSVESRVVSDRTLCEEAPRLDVIARFGLVQPWSRNGPPFIRAPHS